MSKLLDWLNEECCSLMPLAYPTGGGDHDVIWTVIRYQMAEPCEVTIGQGRTATAAIEDAMKDADDPTRWDYVPPQFRDEPRPAQETREARRTRDDEAAFNLGVLRTELPSVPAGHFSRGEINPLYCKNCGGHYDQHLHTDEASRCPTANR